ncbi:UTP--glucose-1-phosphate uridylyltransferase [Candidatus Woesebacteria bacterium]|nr:UTP--glucose-1-phosphate uridylyltransferase [Candidatus Woesebacteria bacterium]QQG47710.1 MAG: UTP--glucose-1-phosphate uridylyltransferase [Candidatus Woesebacteria bacterium]
MAIKAVIPVAGFGTRFLPQTKAMPKEMLPIVDKPIIQIIVEELVKSKIKDIILVTGWHKRAIEDHFDTHPELEAQLEVNGKHDLLEEIRRITSLANFIYVRQKGPYGNATPILNSMQVTDDDPFIVCWGDEFILSDPPMATQLINAHQKYGGMILGAIRTENPNDRKRFGFATGKKVEEGIIEVKEIIEKPGVGRAPSNLATVAGFLFTKDIKPHLEKAVKEINDREPNYIDALRSVIKGGKTDVFALEFKNSKYYDTGSKLGYLEAVVDFGLQHKEIKNEFEKFLKTKI